MTPNSPKVYLGTVGFSYEAWGNGVFYPSDLPRSEWLTYYAKRFNFVEIAHSFSKVPEKEVFQLWYEQTGSDFRFALRGNQYITQVKKLKGIGEPLKLFLEPALKLKEKLACVLWEIPKLGRDQSKLLQAFFKHLAKYPKIRHFFDFSLDSGLDQSSLQLLRESGHELLAKPPADSILESRHYFRIAPEEGTSYREWEAGISKKLLSATEPASFYLAFDGPQAASSIKKAQAFIEKHQISL